jgi:uncharacterized repeat protein (TIGR01451 family)
MKSQRAYLKNFSAALAFFLLSTLTTNAQLTFSVNITQQACTNDGMATFTVSGGTPPYNCYWYGGTSYGQSTVMNNIPAGGYRLVASDQMGIYSDTVITIGVIEIDSVITRAENCIASDGAITVFIHGGSPAYTYAWDIGINHTSGNLSDSLTGLSTGIYGFTILDNNGCTISYNSDTINPYNPSGTISNYVDRTSPITTSLTVTDCNCNDGSATVVASNGTAPYTYYWSNITPAQFTSTAGNLDAFTYPTVTVTDAAGCTASEYAQIDPGPNYIESSANVTYTVCPQATGSISLIPSGGTPPYSLLWNTGATTSIISGLAYGNYSCTITDAAGCSVVRTKFVDHTSPLSVSLNIDSATCGNADGLVIANVFGGTLPYSYIWSDQTTNPTAMLSAGWQLVSVTDNSNCPARLNQFIVYQPDSCYAYITGTVWHDLNGNCLFDVGDFGLPFPDMQISPWYPGNDNSISVNEFGSYSRRVVPSNYTVTQYVPDSWSLACPASPVINFTAVAGNIYSNDFYDQPDSMFNDMKIQNLCFSDTIVHGIHRELKIRWRNSGTTIVNCDAEIHLDPSMDFMGSVPPPTSYDALNHIAYYQLGWQKPRMYGYINVDVLIPAIVPIGDTVVVMSVINPIPADARPLDNTVINSLIVAGSYDPNCKTVSPKGLGAQGFISTLDSVLNYTIYFQNTGTWPAYTVRIVDTLDANLNAASVLAEGNSPLYNCNVSVSGQVVTFEFPNIYLPDSTRDEVNSHGFVSFSVKMKPGLHVGDVISNKGYIYFDFNDAIITNPVVNTISSLVAVDEVKTSSNLLTVFPNPVTDRIVLNFPAEGKGNVQILIYDEMGKIIYRKNQGAMRKGYQQIVLSKDDVELADGLYMVEVRLDGKSMTTKFICTR